MKITSLLPLAAGLLTVAGAANSLRAQAAPVAPAAATATSSLVTNGNFELATKDPAWPDDWVKPKAGVTWETENGKHFLRLKADAPGEMIMAYREVTIPAGTKSVDITIKFRSLGVVHGDENYFDARLICHFLDANHKTTGKDPKIIGMTKSTGDWATQTVTADVPADATKLALLPSLFKVAAGQVDLAEVTVTPK